jgi:hypothetical protein
MHTRSSAHVLTSVIQWVTSESVRWLIWHTWRFVYNLAAFICVKVCLNLWTHSWGSQAGFVTLVRKVALWISHTNLSQKCLHRFTERTEFDQSRRRFLLLRPLKFLKWMLYFSILLHCVIWLRGLLYRVGATNLFSVPLLESTFFCSLTTGFGLTGHPQVCTR